MSTRTPGDDVPVRRIDRILAFMSLGLLVLSIACFFAIMLARPAGVTDFSEGVWPVVSVIVFAAPVIAFAMILFVVISSFVRRARANRGG